MYLFFDTETTGMINRKAPSDHVSQPDMVQLGAILVDGERRVRGELNVIIKPQGWTVPDGAAQIHGMTTAICESYGVHPSSALEMFAMLVVRAQMVVAHNLDFDMAILETACKRYGLDLRDVIHPGAALHCTMKAATPVIQLPGKYGYKWPNLQEAHEHFIGRKFEGAHDAMADVRACRDVFFAMQDGRGTPAGSGA